MNKDEIKTEPLREPITEESLKAFLKSLPGRVLTIGVVHVEDVYERIFGDGYSSSPQRAFLSLMAAKRCAEWMNRRVAITHVLACAEVRELELRLNASDALCLPANEEPGTLEEILKLLNGRDFGWLMTLKHDVGCDVAEPDFENTNENL